MEVTLLSKEEINGKSKIFKKVGRDCNYKYLTRTPYLFDGDSSKFEFYVTTKGFYGSHFDSFPVNDGNCGVRPVLKSDNLEELIKNLKITYENGVEVVEYGHCRIWTIS